MNLLQYGTWTYTEKVRTLISNHIFSLRYLKEGFEISQGKLTKDSREKGYSAE